jgi:hypothetical protein
MDLGVFESLITKSSCTPSCIWWIRSLSDLTRRLDQSCQSLVDRRMTVYTHFGKPITRDRENSRKETHLIRRFILECSRDFFDSFGKFVLSKLQRLAPILR